MTTKIGPCAVIAVGVLFLYLAWFAGERSGPVGFPLDDAWIHMAYGRQMAIDGYLSYNPGVPATGATSPLWAVCLAVLHRVLGWGSVETLVLTTYALGAMLHLVTIWFAMRLAVGAGATALGSSGAGLCLAVTPLMAVSAFSGMEVTLTGALLVLGYERLVRGSWGWAGVLLGLACCTRPEAALSVCCAMVILLMSTVRQGSGFGLRRALKPALRFTLTPLLLGASLMGYNYWASTRLLPATYYLKQATSLGELPERFWVAVSSILTQVAPFAGGWIWIGSAGFVAAVCSLGAFGKHGADRRVTMPIAPLLGGLAFLIGNLIVIAPSDPAAYYHQRYLLPAVPLLLVGLVCGLDRLRFGLTQWKQWLPVGAFIAYAVLMGFASVSSTSRHYHSDTRNINELQRALGEWLGNHTDTDAWIATVDAGAVRYFSHRRAIDIMGLNTPELYWDAPTYAESHPVQAIALMPAWFPKAQGANITMLREVRSDPYTVTSNAAMGWQVVVGCASNGTKLPRRVTLTGMRTVPLLCIPANAGARIALERSTAGVDGNDRSPAR